MPIQPYALGASKGTASTLQPVTCPCSTEHPTYLIIDYVALDAPQHYQDCGPALVETFDYLTFYAAGRIDSRPLPILGYEILHTYRHPMNLLSVRAHYIAWKRTLWRTRQNRAAMPVGAA